ncbi:MAG: hypothetical protein ACK571_03320, partial [Pseudanabaena sp.]
MTDQPKNSENQQPEVEPTQEKNSQLSDSDKSQKIRKLKFPKIGLPKFKIPKLGLPKFKINLTIISDKKRNFLWLCLLLIFASYAYMG